MIWSDTRCNVFGWTGDMFGFLDLHSSVASLCYPFIYWAWTPSSNVESSLWFDKRSFCCSEVFESCRHLRVDISLKSLVDGRRGTITSPAHRKTILEMESVNQLMQIKLDFLIEFWSVYSQCFNILQNMSFFFQWLCSLVFFTSSTMIYIYIYARNLVDIPFQVPSVHANHTALRIR